MQLACQYLVCINEFNLSLALNEIYSCSETDPIVWFSTKFMVLLYFLWLAKKWPALMIEWDRIEQSLPTYIEKSKNSAFFNRIKFYTIMITLGLLS